MQLAQEDEIWRLVPPEEKFAMLAKAQADGTLAAVLMMIVTGTMAVGLHLNALFWTGVLIAPVVFQFSSGKTWRDLRPRAMLEYLAARSAARRYAYSHRAKDLNVNIMFRGYLREVGEMEQMQENLADMSPAANYEFVWIALFPDTVIMMVENPGGAALRFAANINDRFHVEKVETENNPSGGLPNELTLRIDDKFGAKRRYSLKSPYGAALLVFQKMSLAAKEAALREMQLIQADQQLDINAGVWGDD